MRRITFQLLDFILEVRVLVRIFTGDTLIDEQETRMVLQTLEFTGSDWRGNHLSLIFPLDFVYSMILFYHILFGYFIPYE